MSNEIYGIIEFNVSLKVKSNNNHEGILEAYRILNRHSLVLDEINAFIENKFKGLGLNIIIHNNEVEWERFFAVDES